LYVAGLSEELKAFVAAEGFEVVKDFGLHLDYNHMDANQVLKVRTGAWGIGQAIVLLLHCQVRRQGMPCVFVHGPLK